MGESEDKPAFTFEWEHQKGAEPSIGLVRIRDASGKLVQVLDQVESYRQSGDAMYAGTDFNNDGCPDLMVTSAVAGIGNSSAAVFLYKRSARRFEFNNDLSEIGGLNRDARDRNCVTGEWKGGAEDIHTTRHCWKKGKLVLDREYNASPMYNRKGQFQCYQHIDTRYRKGRKHERKDCTKEF